jgi:hypothetical protein
MSNFHGAEQVNFLWDDYNVWYVQDKQAYIEFHMLAHWNQQSAGSMLLHSPLVNIITIPS